MNTILLESKTVYGKTNFYVCSIHKEAVRALTKKQTVDFDDVVALEKLGFKVLMSGREECLAREFLTK